MNYRQEKYAVGLIAFSYAFIMLLFGFYSPFFVLFGIVSCFGMMVVSIVGIWDHRNDED